jgi:hypothetical protein
MRKIDIARAGPTLAQADYWLIPVPAFRRFWVDYDKVERIR